MKKIKHHDASLFSKQVIDAVSSHIAVIDKAGIIISVNKAWTDFGKKNSIHHNRLPERTSIGTNYLEVIKNSKGENKKEASPAYNGILKVINRKLTRFTLEYSCHSKKERRWFIMTVLPLNKKIRSVVITHNDITHRKLLEEYQLKYTAELERTVEERTRELKLALTKEHELADLKSRFISTVSHEFRTPMTSISLAIGFIRKYKDRIDPNTFLGKLDLINDQIQQMTYLLEDVLLIGRNEAGKAKVNFNRVLLRPLIHGFIDDALKRIKSREVKVLFVCINQWICTDENLLRDIISNLLSNAIKFSAKEQITEFTISCDNAHFFFEIKDRGIGIPDKDKLNIFEPFHRGTNTNHIQGNGLGLSIVKNAVDLLGGDITFDSGLLQGTTFKVSLPVVNEITGLNG